MEANNLLAQLYQGWSRKLAARAAMLDAEQALLAARQAVIDALHPDTERGLQDDLRRLGMEVVHLGALELSPGQVDELRAGAARYAALAEAAAG